MTDTVGITSERPLKGYKQYCVREHNEVVSRSRTLTTYTYRIPREKLRDALAKGARFEGGTDGR